MNHPIRVIQIGLGPIGNQITKYLLQRRCFTIVGAIDMDPRKAGQDAAELAGLPGIGVEISADADKILRKEADVVILTTVSSLARATPLILEVLGHGHHIVSTCEELSYPWITQPDLSAQIDQLAKEEGVAVLGTGINPGFLMDFLALAATGVCMDVRELHIERIQNAGFRRIPFQQKIGVGLTVEEFNRQVEQRTLRHVGLTESMHMVAGRLGWSLDRTSDLIEPIIAEQAISAGGRTIGAGYAVGVQQIGSGYMQDKCVLSLHFRASIAETEAYDRIRISGIPDLEMKIPGGVNGDIGTSAITVNAIPNVIEARPGLRTMADISPVTCFNASGGTDSV